MNFREIFLFELGYQFRRASTWLYVIVLLAISILLASKGLITEARSSGYFVNAPFVIAEVTLIGSLLSLLFAAALAGDSGARDVQTRIHPLVYTAPIGKRAYLGGRFFAAFVVNALIQLAVPIGLLVVIFTADFEPELLGPFRPDGYLAAYFFLALPNAFVVTALLFSVAALSRRAMTSYLGAMFVFFASMLSWQYVAATLGRWEIATLLDPLGPTVLSELSMRWTPAQKSTLLVGLERSLILNRLLWVSIAAAVLALTHFRFRFVHPMSRGPWRDFVKRASIENSEKSRSAPIAIPAFARTFRPATRAHQLFTVAWESFRSIVMSPGAIVMAVPVVFLVFFGPSLFEYLGTQTLPTTEAITSMLVNPGDIFLWIAPPFLIVIYAGELIWQERDSGLAEIADATPMPDWVPFVGKLMGLSLVLVLLQALMMAAGMVIQLRMDYRPFELGLYLRVLFGMQLTRYLLFATLALVAHVVVNQKYVAHLVVLLTYFVTVFAPAMGIEHKLLVYASDPGWVYSDMRGFGPFVGPVVWFKLYWAAWALLLAIAAKVLWVRGIELGAGARLRSARRRFTRRTVAVFAFAAGLVLTLGGFVFYNTNVLHEFRTVADVAEWRAGYERRYGRFADVAQPLLTGVRLRVEIYPTRREATIRGTYRLVNVSSVPIDSIHLAPAENVETGTITFDRPVVRALADDEYRHHIYRLEHSLQPGDSLQVGFEVRSTPRGFPNSGVDASVTANGTYFTNAWLPGVGYQRDREIIGAADRRLHGLSRRPVARPATDVTARGLQWGSTRVAFEAVVGTALDQTALAPGTLRRSWTENGRRYFEYATEVPIRNDFAFYSAVYAVREDRWVDSSSGKVVTIQVLHHPAHGQGVGRMIASLRASLEYHTKRFGPYPHSVIRLVERPGSSLVLHSAPINIWYQEAFSLLSPANDSTELDFGFAVVAHEVGHQWWGNQLTPARVEGGALISESLAWFSAMGVVENARGPEHLRQLVNVMRRTYLTPQSRAAVPLLRAADFALLYRKGPFAMYALREYVGEEAVNSALRRMLEKYGAGTPPLATSLDLYRELQAVTPDSLRPLLSDLFETNTYWELSAKRATMEAVDAQTWRVTIEVKARKLLVDSTSVETEVPMDNVVEVGVFAAAEGAQLGELLYLRMHRIHSGDQRITVMVAKKPGRAGIDPRNLLIDVKGDDNFTAVTPKSSTSP